MERSCQEGDVFVNGFALLLGIFLGPLGIFIGHFILLRYMKGRFRTSGVCTFTWFKQFLKGLLLVLITSPIVMPFAGPFFPMWSLFWMWLFPAYYASRLMTGFGFWDDDTMYFVYCDVTQESSKKSACFRPKWYQVKGLIFRKHDYVKCSWFT